MPVDLVEPRHAEPVHPALADKNDRDAPAAESLVRPPCFRIFFDVVLDVRNALLAEIIARLLAIRTPARRIHHDLPGIVRPVPQPWFGGHGAERTPEQQNQQQDVFHGHRRLPPTMTLMTAGYPSASFAGINSIIPNRAHTRKKFDARPHAPDL